MEPRELFKQFNRLNVLIVGDVMIDRYITGKVERISPEAPVPVVRKSNSEDRLGGAANVALNIKAMGASPFLCSVVGKDENAEIFRNLLPKAGIPAQYILGSEHRCTTVKTRIIAASQHLLRIDEEDVHDLQPPELAGFLNLVQKILDEHEIHVILFQDYNKGVLNQELIRKLLLEAVRREIPTVVDPKKQNFFEYRSATLFKPNLKEMREAMPFEIGVSRNLLIKASDYLRSKMRNKNTMITLSDKGIFVDNYQKQVIVPTQARNIADVCGAGDSVISIAAMCTALGFPLEDTAILANLAGGQVCEKVGVVPVDKEKLLEEYEVLLASSET